jgi:hypothetical protein
VPESHRRKITLGIVSVDLHEVAFLAGAIVAQNRVSQRLSVQSSSLLKKGFSCFESLSTNGIFSIISNLSPFVLSPSKDDRRVFSSLLVLDNSFRA